MERFSEILQAMIDDHSARPRNFGEVKGATHRARGVNPVTGDEMDIRFRVDDSGEIREAGFEGRGSAVAIASASVLTLTLAGMPVEKARARVGETIRWIGGEGPVPAGLPEDEYSILLEVRAFPQRIRCASLPWRTAAEALKKGDS